MPGRIDRLAPVADRRRFAVRRVVTTAAAALLAMVWILGPQPSTAAPPMDIPIDAPSARPPTDAPDVSSAAAIPSAANTIIPAWRRAERVGIIEVTGVIDHVTLASLERRIARAVDEGCDAIVLELDTPGGRVDAALDICNLLKDRRSTPANVVAWVRDDAISAGTLMALACREIVVSSQALMGDAAPIQVGLGALIEMAPAERAKVESPLIAEVLDSARRNHYDENLVRAFIAVGVRLWMLEHVRTGERIFVAAEEYEAIFGEEPPRQIASMTPRSGGAVTPSFDPRLAPDPTTGPTRTPEEIEAEIQFQQSLPPARDPLTEADRADWTLIRQVIDDDALLTIKEPEARFYGLASATIDDETQLETFFGATSSVRYAASWSEGLVRFLVSTPVRIVLMLVFVIGFLLEMIAPGTTVFGIAAASALAVLLGAPLLAGMAQWWDVALVLGGIALILVEIFLMPGIGVAGFLGAAMLLVGMVGTFVTGDLDSPTGRAEMWRGLVSTFVAIFGAGVAAWLLSRQIHESPLMRRLVLESEVGGDPTRRTETLLTAAGPADASTSAAGIEVGAEGTAHTDLRPSGTAEIGGRLVDVQAPGQFVEAGDAIRVIGVGTYVIEVERI